MFFRHVGLNDDDLSPHMRELATTRMIERARILGAVMRVAYLVSSAMPNVLPHTPLKVERGKLRLRLKGRYANPDNPLLIVEIKPETNNLRPFELSD